MAILDNKNDMHVECLQQYRKMIKSPFYKHGDASAHPQL